MKKSTAFILAGALLGTLLFSLDQLIVSTAMPQIAHELHGLSQMSWVFIAYMLASTVTIPIYGKLSDIYGRKNFYIFGIVLFLLGSLLSGLSQNMTQLIMFRALQGIGGGAMMVNTQAIIGEIFPPAERGRWQGLNMAMNGLATIAGPLLGGWLTDSLSWRWVFYVNIPIGILAIAIITIFMPKFIRKINNRSIDFWGASLIASGLAPLLLALEWGGSKYPWISWQILTLFTLAVCILFAFILVERKVREPILSLNLFKNRAYTISIVAVFLTMIGLYGAVLYIPLFAQGVVGVTATNSGLILMPMMIGLIVASVLAGQIVSQTGKYRVITIAGMAITVLGMALLSKIGLNTTNTALIWRMVVLGTGLGAGMPIFTTVAQSAFGSEKLGEVTAGKQLFQNIGGTLSAAILGGVLNNQLTSSLTNIQNEPFVEALKKSNPSALTKIDANAIQGFLSPDSQAQIKNMISNTTQSSQAQLLTSFNHLLETIKTALSQAIDHMFLVSTIFMFIALVLVFFLPQIPLRKSSSPEEQNIS